LILLQAEIPALDVEQQMSSIRCGMTSAALVVLALAATIGPWSCLQAHAADRLQLKTEPYAPFSYRDQNGRYGGAGIDQIDVIMRQAQIPYDVEMIPWARAIALAETEPMTCAFSAAQTADRKPRFKWVMTISVNHTILVKRAGSSIHATTLDEAKSFLIGTHRLDFTEDLLKSMGFANLDLSADFDTSLRKLVRGRIDMMPMSEGVYQRLKNNGTDVERVVPLSEEKLGIACQKTVPDALIAKMQSALDSMIRDGRQDTIYRRYGLKAEH
jgi:polar amino acid transport system substrate-binding protein